MMTDAPIPATVRDRIAALRATEDALPRAWPADPGKRYARAMLGLILALLDTGKGDASPAQGR